MFARLCGAEDKEDYKNTCDDLIHSYLDTSSVPPILSFLCEQDLGLYT